MNVPERDPCKPNPCENMGVCSNEDGNPVCKCAEGYEGEDCSGQHLSMCYILQTEIFEINYAILTGNIIYRSTVILLHS